MTTGAEIEFGDFVATRWSRLVRAAALLGCDPQEAEDVTQAALEKCLRAWERSVSRADDVDAYVHRVLINTFVSSRRRAWHRERPTEHLPEGAAASHDVATARVDALQRALRELSVDQRTVVVLRHYAQLSEQQTAAALGVPAGTVKSRLARALRQLATSTHLTDLQESR